MGADQTAAVCGRLLRALLKLDRFIVPHDQVYCLCAQPVRVSTSELLRLMREIQVPMVLLKVGLADDKAMSKDPALLAKFCEALESPTCRLADLK